MSTPHDDYKRLETPDGQVIERCPCCGSEGELWQYSESVTEATAKVVMCVNGTAFGPQDGMANEGCLLYMPPNGHYKATMREAISYWNEFSKALTKQRIARNWQTAKVLREEDPVSSEDELMCGGAP